MSAPVTRRTALRRFGAAGAGLALSAESHARLVGTFGGQTTPITIAGQPVEIRVASIGRSTVRISVVPLADAAALANALPAGRLRSIPGAGHMAPLERPESFTATVSAFLDEIGT